MNLPSDIVQQALDAAGIEYTLGDIEDGTREAQVCLRAYRQCLMQLLRAANWDFARRTQPMELLADATGNTPNVGTVVPMPWTYEYAYPIDCMKVRFVPWNWDGPNPGVPPGNIAGPQGVPQTTGNAQPPLWGRVRPARFVVATDYNYPPQIGQITWETQGVSPSGRTVILTNVPNAQVVYTSLMLYPSTWDALFRAAFVAYLASEIVLPLSKDKKFGMALRRDQIALTKEKVLQARAVDGNEGTYSSDIAVDWLNARRSGGFRGWGAGSGLNGGWGGDGCWGGYDTLPLADGSAY